MTHYIEIVTAARETVGKMLTQRTGQRFRLVLTTRGGKTAGVVRQGHDVRMDLPSLPADTILTRAEADRMVAYLVHEVCHCLHTNYGVWNVAVSEGHRIKHWTNALEDVRIEAHERRVGPYKAMRGLISGLVSHLYAEAHQTLAAEGKSLGRSMLNAPYIVTVLGRAANGYDLPTVKPLKGTLAPNVRKVVELALSKLGACRSTWDCLNLARELVALEESLKPQQPQQPQPQQPQPEQPQGQGDQGEGDQGDQGEDGGDDQGEGKEADDQGEAGDQGKGEEADDQGEEGGNAGASGSDEGDQDPTEEADDDQGAHGEGEEADDQGENGEEADDQGKKGDQPGGTGSGPKQPHEEEEGTEIEPDLNLGNTTENIEQRTGKRADPHDGAHNLNGMTAISVRARNYHTDAQAAKAFLDQVTPANGVLHGQIGRLLVSEARTSRTHHETSGRLDRRALVRMKTGAPDVFSRRDHAPAIDTAVLVLIDLSGSMSTRIELARITAWALAKAAESAGGKLAIAGFTGDGSDCVLHYAKDWSQTVTQAAGAIRSMEPIEYTPLSASIVAGARDLAAQPATRRILIALTDGQCDLGSAAVRSACTLASHLGVEAVGIGINCDQVVAAFPPRYSVNVENIDQLASTGLGTLARMLEEAGAR